MQIIKLHQDFYRTTAYVYAEISHSAGKYIIYDGEMAFKMQPDLTIRSIPPLAPFYRNWEKDTPVGKIDGSSDQLESLRSAIISFIKRIHRTKLITPDDSASINLDVEITKVTEQEAFEMTGLHHDFQNAVIRFFYQRG